MRDRLLSAHSETESALTADAHRLKRVIDNAVVDIDALHAEVERKKALSLHNENAADAFRDRLSASLRNIMEVCMC
jgi:flagellar motor switch protein FliM